MTAYHELYLNDAKRHLSTLFDYAINVCHFESDFFFYLFSKSDAGKQFETGNPAYIAGMSGYELLQKIADEFYQNKVLPEPVYSESKSPEYWAGWTLAQYQWKTGKRFDDINETISLSKIIEMYPFYHEMDISQFYERMDAIFAENQTETKLKKIREACGLSQSELAKEADINLRNIQMYEQRQNKIDKAQANTLYKLARALGCNIEDLLEEPLAG